MSDLTRITVPYEPHDNKEIATMAAIDFLMSRLEICEEKQRVALWVNAKFSKGIEINEYN